MKAIIVAAGQGTRLRPLTDNMPKCMVPFRNKPIIDYIIETLNDCNVDNIVIIDGYKKEVLETHLKGKNIKFYTNENFDSTNMVATLFCAENEMDDDIIISYADIIYKKEVLEKLLNSEADFSVIVDKDWKQLWQMRMENPLDDAETMKIDKNDNIIELGKKPKNYDEIQGQYIGLLKISKRILPKVKDLYHSLNQNNIHNTMFMTDFVQLLINKLVPAKAVYINGGWVEIDSNEDLSVYEISEVLR